MPRIETPDPPETRTTLDLCAECFDYLAPEAESDGWEVEVDHPPYGATDYTCDQCRDPLTDADNWWQ